MKHPGSARPLFSFRTLSFVSTAPLKARDQACREAARHPLSHVNLTNGHGIHKIAVSDWWRSTVDRFPSATSRRRA
jgi:hypothetical protein